MKKDKIKLADKAKGARALYILKHAKVLPENAKELYRAIRIAGLDKET